MFLQVSWNYIWAFQMQKGKRDGQAVSKGLTFMKGKDLSDKICFVWMCVCVYVCVCVFCTYSGQIWNKQVLSEYRTRFY